MPDAATRLYYLIGPSGAGKDTLLDCLKQTCYSSTQPLVAHRYITRPVRENDENHIYLEDFDFERRRAQGMFLFDWESHGHRYAVGREVSAWLQRGNHVIVNGSREYLARAREIHRGLVPVWLSVSEQILCERLRVRGRESGNEIEARLRRNREFERQRPHDCTPIQNDRDISDTVEQLLLLVEITSA